MKLCVPEPEFLEKTFFDPNTEEMGQKKGFSNLNKIWSLILT